MATKIICDHCGNEVLKPTKYMFGPWHYHDDDDDEDEAPRRKTEPVVKREKPVKIDLCNTCGPIWMARVKKLTGDSDPK